VGSDAAVTGRSLRRQPPAGAPLRLDALLAVGRTRDPARVLVEGLRARLDERPVALYASGREALRVALARLARERAREEVLVPGYTCWSVPAAAVAAGLRVRVVDVTPFGQLDLDALRAAPLERAAALVLANLFGFAEPLAELAPILEGAGVALVDDAAQALGARSAEGPAGARGALGVLSFGRGKPLSGLGGGALVGSAGDGPPPAPPRRAGALARALAYDVALAPSVFRWLAEIPGLHVGETIFDPSFRRGPIDGASVCLAAAALAGFDDAARARGARALALARRIESETRFAPLRPRGEATGVYPRLALLAPTAAARAAALAALRAWGATAQYPAALDGVTGLRPHLAGPPHCPGARSLAERILTLPTHGGLHGQGVLRVLATLRSCA